MNNKQKNDIIIIAVILAAALAALLFTHLRGKAGADSSTVISVTVDDDEIFRKSASEISLPYEFDVEGYEGGSNHFIIDADEEGKTGIRCTEADCPDKICVETGRVTMPDQPVVCLPHRITARIIKKP